MKYDPSFAEALKQGPQIAEITLDYALAARAAIGFAPQAAAFSRIIHALADLQFVMPASATTAAYSTCASILITPGYKRLNIEMKITAEMLIQIAKIEGVLSITPPLMAHACDAK